ncbi:MAG: hypothetical protein WCO12_02585 [bacterium]
MKRLVTVFTLLFVLFLFPKPTNAAIFGFGGYNVFAAPCTCSAGTVWYVWYTPLFLTGVPITGAMAVGVPPVGLWYLNYDPLVPTTWSLGKYLPGVQGCWQYSGPTCVTWPTLGYVYQVGSSLPLSTP